LTRAYLFRVELQLQTGISQLLTIKKTKPFLIAIAVFAILGLMPVTIWRSIRPSELNLLIYSLFFLIFGTIHIVNCTYFGIKLIRFLKSSGMNPVISQFLKRVSVMAYESPLTLMTGNVVSLGIRHKFRRSTHIYYYVSVGGCLSPEVGVHHLNDTYSSVRTWHLYFHSTLLCEEETQTRPELKQHNEHKQFHRVSLEDRCTSLGQ
jgi:hypothetical protein